MSNQSATSHVGFFGDAEYAFDLAPVHIIRELEAVTGSGIGALINRVIESRHFQHADLEVVIRLGLIGGGTDPKTAARLVSHYLPARPLEEAMLLAMAILAALFFGASREEAPNPAPDPDATAILKNLEEAAA